MVLKRAVHEAATRIAVGPMRCDELQQAASRPGMSPLSQHTIGLYSNILSSRGVSVFQLGKLGRRPLHPGYSDIA